MKNLAPNITRQRLLIEGFYTIEITKKTIEKYLLDLAQHLNLRTYGEPIIFAPASGMGRDFKFFLMIIYTCKGFDERAVIQFTQEYF